MIGRAKAHQVQNHSWRGQTSDFSPAGRYGQFKPRATMVHVWHFIRQTIFILHPRIKQLKTLSNTQSLFCLFRFTKDLNFPEKKISFKFNSLADHCLNGSFISTLSFAKSGTTQPLLGSCRVSLGHENQRSEGPCAMRSTPHSHGNLAFCDGHLRVHPVGLFVWMDGGWMGGWMGGCVFSRSCFFPTVPFVYGKVRPKVCGVGKKLG